MRKFATSTMRILWGVRPGRTLIRAVLWALVAYLVVRFIAQPVWVRGTSMEPTFRDGTFHIINLLSYRFRSPRVGDVVAIRMAGSRTYYLKRIIAEPGEAVAFSNGQLIVNGVVREEPYIRVSCDWSIPAVVLGTNEYFVAGDNRRDPIESHVAGAVRREKMVGTLWF